MDVEEDEILSSQSSSDDAGSLVEFIVNEAPAAEVLAEDHDSDEEAVKEAIKLTENLPVSVIGGYSMRRRNEGGQAKPARDAYMERFGYEAQKKLLEKDEKDDIIKYVQKLSVEFKGPFEEAGNSWPILNSRMSLHDIREKYEQIKKFADLPDSDDESSSQDDDDDEVEEDEVESESESASSSSENTEE
jgi:hypothetical protein